MDVWEGKGWEEGGEVRGGRGGRKGGWRVRGREGVRGGVEGAERIGKGEGRLDLDIFPGALELLVTPLVNCTARHAQKFAKRSLRLST